VPRPKTPLPSYRHHKPSGRAYSDFTDPATGRRRTICLGKWNSVESKREHARLCSELASGRAGTADGISVSELFLAFLRHAEQHYRDPDGNPTTELKNLKAVMKFARETHGHIPVTEFGPLALKAVRNRLIDRGLCRSSINKDIIRLRHIFKWGCGEELVPPSVFEGLRAVAGLQAGRSSAKEREPILPVPLDVYERTLPHLPRMARTVIEVMRWTGCRPGEAMRLKLAEIDRTGDVWVWRPTRHKTRHKGKKRAIVFGPNAQRVILEFVRGRCHAPPLVFDVTDAAERKRAADAYDRAHRPVDAALLREIARPVEVVSGYVFAPTDFLFDPARDRLERYAEMRSKRRSKVTPSQICRKKAKPVRVPAKRYYPTALNHAVALAAEKAGLDRWHPNQLRHLRGTETRKRFGLEGAQVLLGHDRADVTQIYAERDEAKAVEIARQSG
jgi:integrase